MSRADSEQLAIVIPAWNEARTIAAVVEKVRSFGVVIVVDDGSTDSTAELAERSGARVIRHARNQGYDRALSSGFALAAELSCAFVVTMDADGQHNPQQVADFVRELENGADVVIGIRSRQQRFSEHLFSWVARALWGIRDPLCGMKAYRTAIYKRRGHFDSYGSIGTELAIYAARSGAAIAQVPVSTRARADEPRFGRALRANWRIFTAMIRGFVYAK